MPLPSLQQHRFRALPLVVGVVGAVVVASPASAGWGSLLKGLEKGAVKAEAHAASHAAAHAAAHAEASMAAHEASAVAHAAEHPGALSSGHGAEHAGHAAEHEGSAQEVAENVADALGNVPSGGDDDSAGNASGSSEPVQSPLDVENGKHALRAATLADLEKIAAQTKDNALAQQVVRIRTKEDARHARVLASIELAKPRVQR